MTLTLTLKESLKLTTNILQAGVIEVLAKESKLLAVLPFMDVQGSGYSYNVETSLSDVQFREVGEAITSGNIGIESRTEALRILADEATVDTFQAQVYSNVNDLMAIQVELKAKALAHKFEKTFISGNAEVNPKEFDGIDKRIIEAQQVEIKAGKDGNLDLFTALRGLQNKIQGTPSAYIMNKNTLVDFEANYKNYITWDRNEFGTPLATFGGIPIFDVEPEVLPTDNVVYAARFAPLEGVCGLQNGGVKVTPLGEMDAAPQLKTRLEWFVALAVFNDKTIAKASEASAAPKTAKAVTK